MYRVLIADDEPIERMVITKKLKKMFEGRIEIIQAENGTDALEFYQKNECRIAILDINMPGMSGLKVARKLRELDRDNIAIILTAYDEFDYARQAISAHVLDYLLKPGADEELSAAVEEALQLLKEQDQRKALEKKYNEKDDTENVEAFEEEKQDKLKEEVIQDNVRIRAITGEILEYIQQNYQRDISLQDISGALGYSEAYFCKIFRQCFAKSFTGFLTEYRIQMAKSLLADMKINIKDISMQVGIRDSNYFARIFKRYVGSTPSEYRNAMLSEEEN